MAQIQEALKWERSGKKRDDKNREEINNTGKLISGGVGAVDFAVLIQVMSSLSGLNDTSYMLLWWAILLLCICIPCLVFIFGCYAAMPREEEDTKIKISTLLFAVCGLSGLAISLAISAFHQIAGIAFILASAGAFYAEIELERKAQKKKAADKAKVQLQPEPPTQDSDPQ